MLSSLLREDACLPRPQQQVEPFAGAATQPLIMPFHLLKNQLFDFPLLVFQGSSSLLDIWVWVKMNPLGNRRF